MNIYIIIIASLLIAGCLSPTSNKIPQNPTNQSGPIVTTLNTTVIASSTVSIPKKNMSIQDQQFLGPFHQSMDNITSLFFSFNEDFQSNKLYMLQSDAELISARARSDYDILSNIPVSDEIKPVKVNYLKFLKDVESCGNNIMNAEYALQHGDNQGKSKSITNGLSDIRKAKEDLNLTLNAEKQYLGI
jgi:hypothetical protein